MKHRLNIFAAVFITLLCGVELRDGSYFSAAFSGLLVILNLWAAGFFDGEDK